MQSDLISAVKYIELFCNLFKNFSAITYFVPTPSIFLVCKFYKQKEFLRVYLLQFVNSVPFEDSYGNEFELKDFRIQYCGINIDILMSFDKVISQSVGYFQAINYFANVSLSSVVSQPSYSGNDPNKHCFYTNRC